MTDFIPKSVLAIWTIFDHILIINVLVYIYNCSLLKFCCLDEICPRSESGYSSNKHYNRWFPVVISNIPQLWPDKYGLWWTVLRLITHKEKPTNCWTNCVTLGHYHHIDILNKMSDTLQMTFPNAFRSIKIRVQWIFFLRFQVITCQHWFRLWFVAVGFRSMKLYMNYFALFSSLLPYIGFASPPIGLHKQ